MKILKPLLVLIVVLIVVGYLSGCDSNPVYGENGLIRDSSQDYQKAQALPSLKVPSNLDSSAVHQAMVVPEVEQIASQREKEFEVPRPTIFYAEAGNDVVNLARDGFEKYIQVEQPYDEVWKTLGEFWQYNNFSLALSDPASGVMETQWLKKDTEEDQGFFASMIDTVNVFEIDGPYQDKLRLVLTRVDENKTATRMQHMRMSTKEGAEEPSWDSGSQDIDYRSEMMYSLLSYLSKSTNSSTALAYKASNDRDKVRGLLGRDSDGNPVLKLPTDISKGWQWVEMAMAAAEMDVGSSNPGLGKFYITYTTSTPFTPDEGFSFWKWFKSLHSDDAEKEKITFTSDFLDRALGRDPDDDPNKRIKYSAKKTEPTDPNDPSQVDGYKVWLAGEVVYVFRSDKAKAELNEETGELEHTGRYQIRLDRRRTGVFVYVLTDEARPANHIVAEEILWDIKDHLPTS